MSTVQAARATLADLAQFDGKAELINGMVVPLMPSGQRPTRLSFRLARLLEDYSEPRQLGLVYTDGLGYTVPELLSGRESFSPDVSLYVGDSSDDSMSFIPGVPAFAVEIRSEHDYGPAAERALAAKRADYFEAGTPIVWDVDPVARVVRCYRLDAPDLPTVFAAGLFADAEPAVPGWRVAVDDLLR